MSRIPVGLCFNLWYLSPTDCVELGEYADGVGYDSLWITEGLGVGDAVSVLSALTQKTRRLRLASSVVGIYTRHPLITAMTFSSLHKLSGGRVILGLGLSNLELIDRMGIQHSEHLRDMAEATALIRSLFEGSVVNSTGRFGARGFSLHERFDIPIYIGAVGDMMLRFASRKGDGVIFTPGCSLKYVRRATKTLRSANRSKDVPVASLLLCAPDDTDLGIMKQVIATTITKPGRAEMMLDNGTYSLDDLSAIAKELAKGKLPDAAARVPESILDQMVIRGSAAKCRDKVIEHVDCGVSVPVLTCVSRASAILKLGKELMKT